MRIFIDGDSCSVTAITEKIASANNIECHIYCDTSRLIDSDYAQVHIVDKGPNAADFAIINACESNDIVITNDSGLAAMALTKRCFVLNCKGIRYTDTNIMSFLNRRHLRQDAKKKTHRNNINGINCCSRAKRHPSFPTSLKNLILMHA
jgi:uncharacterized protein YaiI (UPF0178 family)